MAGGRDSLSLLMKVNAFMFSLLSLYMWELPSWRCVGIHSNSKETALQAIEQNMDRKILCNMKIVQLWKCTYSSNPIDLHITSIFFHFLQMMITNIVVAICEICFVKLVTYLVFAIHEKSAYPAADEWLSEPRNSVCRQIISWCRSFCTSKDLTIRILNASRFKSCINGAWTSSYF